MVIRETLKRQDVPFMEEKGFTLCNIENENSVCWDSNHCAWPMG